ncbi:flagellar hook-basal body complex protein FliE [Vibrio diabolicus]|uniref:flagellar hook-basal body complex protein FliE n=1 Tax=Vibrio diabolicus TaxID=50719 RepID=UPI00373ED26B
MASQPTHAVSAEQLMLSKMQAMQAQVQPPEFIVSANPLDQQSLNAPLSFSLMQVRNKVVTSFEDIMKMPV